MPYNGNNKKQIKNGAPVEHIIRKFNITKATISIINNRGNRPAFQKTLRDKKAVVKTSPIASETTGKSLIGLKKYPNTIDRWHNNGYYSS